MPTDNTVIRRIHALRQMTVPELYREWNQLYPDRPTRSRNKDYLYRRLAWRIQELHHGGLSNHARDRIDQLAPNSFTRARTSHVPHDALNAPETRQKPRRDRSLPPPGTVLVRAYKGSELRLVVHDDHFELDGQAFHSLSSAARHVTGSKWNGRLFWGLTDRKRK